MLERFRTFATAAAHQALCGFGEPENVPRSVVAVLVAGALPSEITGWLDDGMRVPPRNDGDHVLSPRAAQSVERSAQ
jgi:hypothetical protein